MATKRHSSEEIIGILSARIVKVATIFCSNLAEI